MASLLATLGQFTADYLIPFMLLIFALGTVLKMFIYYVSKKLHIISTAVETKVHRHMEGKYEDTQNLNFYSLTKTILDKTFHEHFIMRLSNQRRRFDKTASFLDRIFYIDAGANILFEDTIKQTKFYKKKEDQPQFRSMASFAFSANRYFNQLFGVIPLKVINNLLLILPGLFIVGGIFGTFLGIVKGIPALKGMDPSNIDATKITLGVFLDQMAYSMNTSLVGICLSVFFTVINSLFSPKTLEREAFTKFTHCLEFLWRNSHEMAAAPVQKLYLAEVGPNENDDFSPPDLPELPDELTNEDQAEIITLNAQNPSDQLKAG